MNKTKLFIENFLVYGIGGVIGKLIPLIMLPIVTRLMPNTSYIGMNDMATTLVSITSYLALMGMYDAMYRMFFEKKDIEYQKQICSTTFIFTFLISAFICLFLIGFKNIIAKFFFDTSNLSYLVIISALTTLFGATNTIVSGPARMQNKRKIYVLMNTVGPLLSYSIAIILLIKKYYIIALPFGNLLSVIFNEIVFVIYNKSWFSIRNIKLSYLKPMLVFAIPLMPNFLVYWIFGSSDRIMITNLIGLDQAGIYAIGSKLGNASQLIYTAFAGGWQYFAFSTMNDDNQVESNSKIFEYMGVISLVCTSVVCSSAYTIYSLMFPKEYICGYIVSPYLFLAPLLQMLFQIAVSQFAIIKKTWPNMFILGTGAILNIVLNLILIPILGIEGAAIATLIGYIVSDFIAVVVLTKIKLMKISKKFCICIFIFFLYFVSWRAFFSSTVMFSFLSSLLLVIILVRIYKDDLILFLKHLKKK